MLNDAVCFRAAVIPVVKTGTNKIDPEMIASLVSPEHVERYRESNTVPLDFDFMFANHFIPCGVD